MRGLLAIALIVAACGGSATPAASTTTAVSYSAAQVSECQNANDTFGQFPDWTHGQSVASDRASLADEVDRDLNAAQFLDRPSAAGPQWDALLSALRTGAAQLKKKMTLAQFDAAYASIETPGYAFFLACNGVTVWGAANLPQ